MDMQEFEVEMTPWFEELDYCRTPMGDLFLQRRRIAALDNAEVYEVKLGDAYLMSSLFHDAEVALTDLALEQLTGEGWRVVVGGLGLGYTAAAACKYPQMQELVVVEALEPVIDWHRRGLVPNGRTLQNDPRCRFLHSDFFALARGNGFASDTPGKRFDAVLLDIDHTPNQFLASPHASFYTEEGLRSMARFLQPHGVFALWSNEPPDPAFVATLQRVFAKTLEYTIPFDNPLQQVTSSNGIYIASTPL